MLRPNICLVTPAFADANNGNWQTARRWSQMLSQDYRVDLTGAWNGAPAELLIALHARRSAASVERFARECPGRPIAVVLTGTDLYRDIHTDAAAQASLDYADCLIVLHEGAVQDLPERLQHKAVVCFQSTTRRAPVRKPSRFLRAVMVGHLRSEKDPHAYWQAARLLQGRTDIRLQHIGAALEPAWGDEARAVQIALPQYHWLGALPHAATRRHVQHAHVLVHPSRMEGGAHVIMEAVCSGTPVLASRISGNVGMLGGDYDGYFEPGDAQGLARLLKQCRDDAAILAHLTHQCALRSPLFAPERERATLVRIANDLIESPQI